MFDTIKPNLTKPGKKFLVADCADAISSAFVNVFGPETVVIHCWAHTVRNLKDNFKKFGVKDPVVKDDIFADISKIQVSKTEFVFKNNIKLFFDKWDAVKQEHDGC